jgi:hypothetical protein
MFREVAAIGSLDVQLVHCYGPDGFKASPWVSDATALADLMEKIECRSGYTQIAKVLAHVHTENAAQKLSALVFIGDAVEGRARCPLRPRSRAWCAGFHVSGR